MADIYVERKSQKGIIIGHKGIIKKVGIASRQELENSSVAGSFGDTCESGAGLEEKRNEVERLRLFELN